MLEGLADFPGAASLLGLALQVAARHVERHAVAPDVVERLFQRDVLATLAEGDRQLDLVVHVVRLGRSEEHTSELQSLMRISYAVFCLKKKTTRTTQQSY